MGSLTNLLQQNGVTDPGNQMKFLVLKPLLDAIKQLDGLSAGSLGSLGLS
ncbi:hypothetical protein [Prescottella subtropica]|nr:hypothetical protein [Prescottella subtropica]